MESIGKRLDRLQKKRAEASRKARLRVEALLRVPAWQAQGGQPRLRPRQSHHASDVWHSSHRLIACRVVFPSVAVAG